MVEPQIKEGKGGLRDLHTLFWIAKFAYKVNSVEEIIERGVLRVSEANNFASSQRFLWTVRCFLHLRSKREDDRLTFDAQIDIAPLMGLIIIPLPADAPTFSTCSINSFLKIA